jgi:hypothetical protein
MRVQKRLLGRRANRDSVDFERLASALKKIHTSSNDDDDEEDESASEENSDDQIISEVLQIKVTTREIAQHAALYYASILK